MKLEIEILRLWWIVPEITMATTEYRIIVTGLPKTGKTSVLTAYNGSQPESSVLSKYVEFDKIGNFLEVPTETPLSTLVSFVESPDDFTCDAAIVVCDSSHRTETLIDHIELLLERSGNTRLRIGIILNKADIQARFMMDSALVRITSMFVDGSEFPKSLSMSNRNAFRVIHLSALTGEVQVKLFINSIVRDVHLIRCNPVIKEIAELTAYNASLTASLRALKRENLDLLTRTETLVREKAALEMKQSKIKAVKPYKPIKPATFPGLLASEDMKTKDVYHAMPDDRKQKFHAGCSVM